MPAIWLGLTDATAENGCLRVVPRSHRLGLVPHADRPDPHNLTTQGMTAQVQIDSTHDIIMREGEMSLHHPLILRVKAERIGRVADRVFRDLLDAGVDGKPNCGGVGARRWTKGVLPHCRRARGTFVGGSDRRLSRWKSPDIVCNHGLSGNDSERRHTYLESRAPGV